MFKISQIQCQHLQHVLVCVCSWCTNCHQFILSADFPGQSNNTSPPGSNQLLASSMFPLSGAALGSQSVPAYNYPDTQRRRGACPRWRRAASDTHLHTTRSAKANRGKAISRGFHFVSLFVLWSLPHSSTSWLRLMVEGSKNSWLLRGLASTLESNNTDCSVSFWALQSLRDLCLWELSSVIKAQLH